MSEHPRHPGIPPSNSKIVPPYIPPPRKESLKSENARLKAEVERLTSNNARLKEAIDDSYKAVDEMEKRMREWDEEILNVEIAKNAKLMDEIEQLKEAWVDKKMQEDRDALLQQVERLTKAGDELHAFLINYIVESRISSAYLNKLDDGWHAAKEGKQP